MYWSQFALIHGLERLELPILIWASDPYTKHEPAPILRTTNPIIKHKTGLLNPAEELKNMLNHGHLA
jgi:hypothetical protein